MHEFNVCQTIVETVLAQALREGGEECRVVRATVIVGRLRQLVPEHLASAYASLTTGTVAQGSVLDIVRSPIVFTCEACGRTTQSEVAVFTCRSCGSKRGVVTGGRELYVESVEIES